MLLLLSVNCDDPFIPERQKLTAPRERHDILLVVASPTRGVHSLEQAQVAPAQEKELGAGFQGCQNEVAGGAKVEASHGLAELADGRFLAI